MQVKNPNEIELNKESRFDIISYIESFFKYKFDPVQLLEYFDSKGIDIETADKA